MGRGKSGAGRDPSTAERDSKGESRSFAQDDRGAGRRGVGTRNCEAEIGWLLVAGDADPFFHLVEVFGQGAAAGCGQAVFGAGDAAFEKLYAGNVLRLFELAGVDAE